jgi:glucan phosphorylase
MVPILQKEELKRQILERLVYSVGKDVEHAVDRDWCVALTLAIRDRLVDGWMETTRRIYRERRKRVYYLSMEFLIGRLLGDTLSNLGLTEVCRHAMADLGVSLDAILEEEPDAALGNGGLGRLAACYLDSMATLGIAGFGYGIRYQHGLFRQRIVDGWQVEEAEDWLTQGRNPLARRGTGYRLRQRHAGDRLAGRSCEHAAVVVGEAGTRLRSVAFQPRRSPAGRGTPGAGRDPDPRAVPRRLHPFGP